MSDEINNWMDCRFYAVSLAMELELDRFLEKKQRNEEFDCRYPSTVAEHSTTSLKQEKMGRETEWAFSNEQGRKGKCRINPCVD